MIYVASFRAPLRARVLILQAGSLGTNTYDIRVCSKLNAGRFLVLTQ